MEKRDRIDWRVERERIDLAAVAAELLGPAPGRRGERGHRLWWSCPLGTHEDRNPSFMIDPDKRRWRCWGCGQGGDAIDLLMRVDGFSFPKAMARLTGRSTPADDNGPRPPRRAGPRPKPAESPVGPSGMPAEDALALIRESEDRLLSPEGSGAVAYLTGFRCLSIETIRAAHLGWTPGIRLATRDGRPYWARGIVLPWFDGARLALVKIRQPEGERPKYVEVFRDRPSLYPTRRVIRPGLPLVVAEGEFDTLLLGQVLEGMAAVVTLGGTGSTKPEPGILGSMLAAAPWFIATDADEAGDVAAARWGATRARRVRPPGSFNDWTDARRAGVNLRRWWSDRMDGVEAPPLFDWGDLAGWRWGPADESPDIDDRGPERETSRLA